MPETMTHSRGRRLAGVGVGLGLLALGTIIFLAVGGISSGNSAGISPPSAEQQKALAAQAREVVDKYGNAPVNSALVVATTRSSISQLAGYDAALNPALGSTEPVFVVSLQGKFTDTDASSPRPAPAPTGTQIVFVDRASDLTLLDWYVLQDPLTVTKLVGAQTTLDLTQQPPTP